MDTTPKEPYIPPYNGDKFVELGRILALEENDPTTLSVGGFCPITGQRYHVSVKEKDWAIYMEGNLPAPEVFPYLNHDDMDLVICGITPKGFRILSGLDSP